MLATLVLGCASARPPRVEQVAVAPPPPPRRLNAPAVTCSPPIVPTLTQGWRLQAWPSAPRLQTVETYGGVLYGATSSAVCASSDGGSHWRSLLEQVDWPTLHLAPGRLVVRTGIDPEGNPVAAPRWYLSEDGGERWGSNDRAPLLGMDATTPSVAAPGEAGEAVPCGGALFSMVRRTGRASSVIMSVDGGETWQRTRGLTLPSGEVSIHCVSSGQVTIERRDGLPVAVSRDAGASWRSVRPPPIQLPTEELGAVAGSPALRGRGCGPFGARGLFCELYGQTWVSDDDGTHWRRSHSPVGGRALLDRAARIVGVGGGVAESRDGGRQWSLLAPAAGRANLGFRGGILPDGSLWLVGAAIWWSDDGGVHWRATLLPFELVAVTDRRRWVGFEAPTGSACGGTLRITRNAGRTWTRAAQGLERVAMVDGHLVARRCGGDLVTSDDGLRWRPSTTAPPDDEPNEVREAITRDGVRVRVSEGALEAVREGSPPQRIAHPWPADVVPVAATSVGSTLDTVLFGNGSVLRHEP